MSETHLGHLMERPNITNKQKNYNTPGHALQYELTAEVLQYQAPRYCADLLAGLLVNVRAHAKVLDAAAGSGHVGVELSKRGFNNITAQDGSFCMLDLCREKGVYRNYMCCLIESDGRLPIDDGVYDAVTVSGAIMEHHLPQSCQAEFARVVKPGGYIITAYDSDILDSDYGRLWEKETRRLLEDGVCSLYAKVIVPNYLKDKKGVINILQVL
ncbi:unnamed protein product [Candidula unifasciata]|uniref:Methyltransferase type 11 domain-containing protein n=1 Tax=Candidula unifasciata TaxID=100452 RepID=A0A8S3YQU7_9EUPU|nr:unnamed protein product [Candidula unifasciata]